jgi:hypothetical protein
VFWIDVVQHLKSQWIVGIIRMRENGAIFEKVQGMKTDLLYPVFPIVCTMIPPTGSRYSTVPHHKEWHHLGDYLA